MYTIYVILHSPSNALILPYPSSYPSSSSSFNRNCTTRCSQTSLGPRHTGVQYRTQGPLSKERLANGCHSCVCVCVCVCVCAYVCACVCVCVCYLNIMCSLVTFLSQRPATNVAIPLRPFFRLQLILLLYNHWAPVNFLGHGPL